MRTILVPILIALALVPLAQARPDLPDTPDPWGGRVDVAGCAASWGFMVPGHLAGATCTIEGHEVFFVSADAASLGYRCTVRAADGAVSSSPCREGHAGDWIAWILRELFPATPPILP